MNRLTKVDRYNHYYTNEKIYSRTDEFSCFDGSVIDKLGQLEDIEDNLDIDLRSVKVWTNPETQKVDVISMYDKQHKNEIVIKVKEVNTYRK